MQRVSPTESERRITSKLGDYRNVLGREPTTHRIGAPVQQSTVPRPSSTSQQQQQQQTQPYQNSVQPNRNTSSSSTHPYNQQAQQTPQVTTQQHSIAPSQNRNNTFLKPESKYNGRPGNYSGQQQQQQQPPVKHEVSFCFPMHSIVILLMK